MASWSLLCKQFAQGQTLELIAAVKLADIKHVFVKAAPRVNNRAENNHQPTRERERRMRGFRSPQRTQAFLSSFGTIRQYFAIKRHCLGTVRYRILLAKRFASWHRITEITQYPSTAF
jgi:putative transposase